MENIKSTLKRTINKDIDKNFNAKKMDTNLMKIIKMENLTEEDAKKHLSSLEDTSIELNNCKNCKGLNECKNHLKGHVYYPSKNESKVTFNYIPCKYLKKHEQKMLEKDSNYIILNARMKDIDVTDEKRVKIIKWLKNFYDKYEETKVMKGLYLHGSFGSGKTFLLAALLNELHEVKNVDYEIVYVPELLRSLKDNFSLLDSKVRYYSNVEILLLDDIGAEKVTDWGRDEILGTILQSRMNNHKVTFFTSNFTLDELEKHLSITSSSEDIVKAKRIIERIRQLTEDIEIITINHRN